MTKKHGVLNAFAYWQSPTASTDPFNSAQQWTTNKKVRCSLKELSGRELVNARQIKATVTAEIVIRNPEPRTQVCPVKPTDRFLFEDSNRVFNVDYSFREDEKNMYIIIFATERSGETP